MQFANICDYKNKCQNSFIGKEFISKVIYFSCGHWGYQSSKYIHFVPISTTPDIKTTSLPLKYFYSNPKLEVSYLITNCFGSH